MDIQDEKEQLRAEFKALVIEDGIEADYADTYFEVVFEVATGLVSRGGHPVVLGVSGAQGTGKSTFAKMLAVVFERAFDKKTLVMSLDDFYLTRAAREQLAKDVHPLLITRGVPGTHDIALLNSVLDDLVAGRNTKVPVFDKAVDDRAGMVPVMGAGLDLVVVEGWCWGASPCSEAELEAPINALEQTRDQDRTWRTWVNRRLSIGGYAEVFARADVLFFLAAPNLEAVFKWRWQQEQQLATRSTGKSIMNAIQVREFIMYYERITRRMLTELPRRANLTIYLDERHRFIQPPASR